MSQQYSLRWNNHQPNFISMFGNLLATKDLVDVTLAAEGQQLVAHKIVLSACSTYFHSLFVDNPTHHPIVILKDVTFSDLSTMVHFMYHGEVNVTEQQLTQVLETAKILKIKGLTEMPDSSALRSQGIANEFPPTETSSDTQRPSVSPLSPLRRKRQRKSSSGSLANPEDLMQNVDMMREAVTLSSLHIHKKRDLDGRMEVAQQTDEASSITIDQLAMDSNSVGMSQGAQWNLMENQYPRYSNTGIGGGGMQPDQATMYMNNVIHPHGDDMSHYALGAAGPIPGTSSMSGMNEQVGQIHSVGMPAKRRRTTNPQGEENFQKALEAVRVGGIGFCKAARMFGVNNRTLWLEYKKKGYPNNRPSIKNRIKREHVTPPPDVTDDTTPQLEQRMALLCQPPPVPVNFIDHRPMDFPQINSSPLSIINNVNFSMQ